MWAWWGVALMLHPPNIAGCVQYGTPVSRFAQVMSDQNVNPDNCFDERVLSNDPALDSMIGSPLEIFLKRHRGHAVTDMSAAGPNTESVTVRCADCDIAFAAAQ